jgi:ATP-binding cassette subfamily B protein
MGLALLAATGIGLMGFEPILIRELIDELGRPSPDIERAWWMFFLVAGVWFLSSIANRFRDWLDLHTAPELRKQAQLEVYCWLEGHSTQFFQDHMAGSLSQKVKQVGTAMVSLSEIIFNGFVRVVVAIVIAALVLASAPAYFFYSFLAWLVVFLSLSAWFAKRCTPYFRAFSEEASATTGILVDAVTHMDLIKAHAKKRFERLHLFDALTKEKSASINTRWFLIWMMLVLYSGLLLFQALFIGLSLHAFLAQRMTLGELVMVISLAAILVANVWGLSTQLIQYFEQVGTLESALAQIGKDHGLVESPDARPLVVRQGEITFDGIDYQLADGRWLFRRFKLTIRGHEKVGLVGPSGAGKSTLTRLLRRQFDLHGGRILIDEQDIAGVTLDSLNRAIGEVPQDPALFHRSLRSNIGYPLDHPSDEEIERAMSLAHCEAFIYARPEGLDALVGEGGVKLSGGERQRVALARAFVKNAPILVLDEATSALDSHTEAQIQDAIEKLTNNRTVLVIAHRLSTLTRMDRIVVLKDGQICEQGTHSSLLAANGVYASLWQTQSAHFLTT